MRTHLKFITAVTAAALLVGCQTKSSTSVPTVDDTPATAADTDPDVALSQAAAVEMVAPGSGAADIATAAALAAAGVKDVDGASLYLQHGEASYDMSRDIGAGVQLVESAEDTVALASSTSVIEDPDGDPNSGEDGVLHVLRSSVTWRATVAEDIPAAVDAFAAADAFFIARVADGDATAVTLDTPDGVADLVVVERGAMDLATDTTDVLPDAVRYTGVALIGNTTVSLTVYGPQDTIGDAYTAALEALAATFS